MEDKPKRDPQKRVTIVPDAKGGPKSAGAKPISAPISAVVAPSVPAHFKDTRDSTTNWRSACQKIVERGENTLEELSIRERLTASDLQLLAAVFQHPSCRISRLTLASAGVFDHEAEVILNALLHNKSVTYIDLSDNNLTEDVSAALIALAQNTRTVTAIRLDGNEVFLSTRSVIADLLAAVANPMPENAFAEAAPSPNLSRSLSTLTKDNMVVTPPTSGSASISVSLRSSAAALSASQSFAAALQSSSSSGSATPASALSANSNTGTSVNTSAAVSSTSLSSVGVAVPTSLPSPSSSSFSAASSPGSSRNVSPPRVPPTGSKSPSRPGSPLRGRRTTALATSSSGGSGGDSPIATAAGSSSSLALPTAVVSSTTPPFSTITSSNSLAPTAVSISSTPSPPIGLKRSATTESVNTSAAHADMTSSSEMRSEKEGVQSVVLLMKKEQELKAKVQAMQEQLKKLEEKLAETQSVQNTIAKSITSLQKVEADLKDSINKHEEKELKIKGKKGTLFNKNKMKIDLRSVSINQRIAKAGGSGAAVFACTVDGWQCAVKEISLEMLDAADSNGFEAEIQLLEKLPPHKNIVRYLFHDRTANKLRLFMTRYHSNLRDFITAHRPAGPRGFTPNDVRLHALEIIRGLEFLHRHNVLHRDLKADNVFVTLDERNEIQNLAIGDFNISRYLSHRLTRSIVGTPAWMAPEIFEGGGYSYKADIYSFGMILFELMTSQRPFYERKGFDVPQLVQNGIQPVFPEELPETFAALIKMYKQCISRKAEDRPDTATLKESLKTMKTSAEK